MGLVDGHLSMITKKRARATCLIGEWPGRFGSPRSGGSVITLQVEDGIQHAAYEVEDTV